MDGILASSLWFIVLSRAQIVFVYQRQIQTNIHPNSKIQSEFSFIECSTFCLDCRLIFHVGSLEFHLCDTSLQGLLHSLTGSGRWKCVPGSHSCRPWGGELLTSQRITDKTGSFPREAKILLNFMFLYTLNLKHSISFPKWKIEEKKFAC